MVINKEEFFTTSDSHHGHGNILKYSNRPFMNEHEQSIVDKYNSHVWDVDRKVDDEVRREYKNLRISRESIERMDEAMIENWNNKVPKNGSVFHLGDFSFNAQKALEIIPRLNGKIYHIRGNHDKNVKDFGHLFEWTKDYYELKVRDQNAPRGMREYVLLHYAMRVWNKSHHGVRMLFGHSHHTLPDDPNGLSMDVGVDGWNYTPLSYDDVESFMGKKNWKPKDHHGRNH